MDYTIKLSVFFEPKAWMINQKIKSFLRKRKEGDLILLIDDKIPNLAPLLTTFKNYDKEQPGEFIGKNPIYLLAPSVEYDDLTKIVNARIKNPKEEGYRGKRINYVPDRLYYGADAVDALKNEEGHNMKEFRIYSELIENNMIRGIEWDYSRNLLEEIS